MSVPGMMYPTLKGMPAGNPRDAAITNMNNAAAIQAQANNAVGGRKRMRSRRSRKGGASNIVVPQFNMSYEPQGGPGTNPNDQIASNAQVGTQGAANSALDAGAFKKGGSKRSGSKRSRRSRKGGNPDWVWGCSSGGKRSRRSKRSNRKRKSSKKRH
jgi:hypothetical protein